MMRRSWLLLFLVHLLVFQLYTSLGAASDPTYDEIRGGHRDGGDRSVVIEVEGGPSSVVWVVQLSDLHFSVHYPERAHDFRRLIGPTLAMIKPSLVLITGDLTDAKSKDLLTMKQDEKEWIEYQNTVADVIKRSGLEKKLFYDLRGNHDQFGVPVKSGAGDFFNKYSNNANSGRFGNVHSVTLKNRMWKHLFVGFDSAMPVGLRGPTNLFGHPSEQMLDDLDAELSQWDSQGSELPISKISFGHFPISFSATSENCRSLKDIFLKHSISAYICGHLHSRFGKNLKRHHHEGNYFPFSGNFYQLNMHCDKMPDGFEEDCSKESEPANEFWEWEMADWRKSRAIRILAIDAGHVSFLDTDLTFGIRKTIILPTFPLDSRFMQRASSYHDYRCQHFENKSYETIRSLVFSVIDIYVVYVKIYDTRSGHLDLVMDATMRKHNAENNSRGDLYEAPWNWRAFADPLPDRYWLQIVAVDIMGDSTFSQLQPFSVNGHVSKVKWTWTEFKVMGIQWGSVFYPILYTGLVILFSILLVPRAFLVYARNSHTNSGSHPYTNGRGMICFLLSCITQMLLDFSKLTFVWSSVLLYSVFLTFFPWFSGNIFTEIGHLGQMTIYGWLITSPDSRAQSRLGSPDIMVVVLPHFFFVVFPVVMVMSAMSCEQAMHIMHCISSSKKKQDDINEYKKDKKNHISLFRNSHASGSRKVRKILLLMCLAIFWNHWKQCRSLVKAYEMNPFIHAPIFCFFLPLLLVYTIYLTGATQANR